MRNMMIEKEWLCECLYHNVGPICTKCGTLKSKPSLVKIKEKWLKRRKEEISEWYNDCDSIDEFIDDIDMLLDLE